MHKGEKVKGINGKGRKEEKGKRVKEEKVIR